MQKLDLSDIKLSVVVTVFSETFSLSETVERILKNDRGYISEILLAISPRSSQECIDICQHLNRKYDRIKLHMQKNNPGVGWAIREGMELSQGNYIALLSADLETEPEAVDRMV
ncbi:MAG: glycosyltransferase, partial [Proteobacteria bacterium]|nr:glycosyltransferase [Pseudomonadota bacterium]